MHEWGRCCDEAANHLLPIAEAFWIIPIVSTEEMFKLNIKFDTDSLFYLLSHFECDSHTIHMLTQQCLPSPLTSTVKLSLFTHVLSSPFSLAAELYRCHPNSSRFSNSGWIFPRQTSYMNAFVNVYVKGYVFVFPPPWKTSELFFLAQLDRKLFYIFKTSTFLYTLLISKWLWNFLIEIGQSIFST